MTYFIEVVKDLESYEKVNRSFSTVPEKPHQ